MQDETRAGQKGITTRQWAKKGTRPRVVKQQQHISVYLFGAVCPDREQSAALILPDCNTKMMGLHLNEISRQVPEGRHAVVVLDKAAWHTTEKLKLPENISLLPLPAYSPELNSMEQVWEFIKQKWLSNRVYKDYEGIADSCAKAWNLFRNEAGRIKSLCSREWATVGV